MRTPAHPPTHPSPARDLFAEYYRKRLSRRLIHGGAASDDAERRVLASLKQQCGAQFTQRMEGMVSDIVLARDRQRAFDDWAARSGRALPLDLGVTVLTTGHWPKTKAVESLTLPAPMAAGVAAYTEFYSSTNTVGEEGGEERGGGGGGAPRAPPPPPPPPRALPLVAHAPTPCPSSISPLL